MITVKKVSKIYGNKDNQFYALKNVSLSIEDGSSLAIVGKSGSGKSTLMHIMAGLDNPTKGEVMLNKESLYNLSSSKISSVRNQSYGFIFQQFFLQPHNSCLENVLLPLKVRKLSKKEREKMAEEALNEVGLKDKVKEKTVNLSGGQKQRVCIARAIVTKPQVIFADEPTGNLDTETGSNIIDTLFNLNKSKGITLIIVTHDEDLANRCQRKVYIKDGKVYDKNPYK